MTTTSADAEVLSRRTPRGVAALVTGAFIVLALVGAALAVRGPSQPSSPADVPAVTSSVPQTAYAAAYDAGKRYGEDLLKQGHSVAEVTEFSPGACAYVRDNLGPDWTAADAPLIQQGCLAGFMTTTGHTG